ncbi:hypothetical protein ACFPOU_09215 [Massilia jejuensis]|uniref:Uncharacterized protein n=1 Tax=Massilia jejuensis TaxID=648894 RepID=A0ABW0PF69_9BURK
MPTFYVSYMIGSRPDTQQLYFDHPAALIDDPDVLIREIVKHEFPKDPDPFLERRSDGRDRALRKYGLSNLKTYVQPKVVDASLAR